MHPCWARRPQRSKGTLVVLASGGDQATRAPLAPVLDAIGSRTIWLGSAGEGSRLKLERDAIPSFGIDGGLKDADLAAAYRAYGRS